MYEEIIYIMIGVYYETWSSVELPSINADVVYLAFCNPNTQYLSSNSFDGTGLEFTKSFAEVKTWIQGMAASGKKVMLSVGGGSYPYPKSVPVNFNAIQRLAGDLGCSGIDIDWEPNDGIGSKDDFGPIIAGFRKGYSGNLSAACWSTGAYGPQAGDTFKGMNIAGLESNGSMLNWINIMAYDAGSNYDPCGAYDCYRIYFKGQILVGFELGKQGWGNDLLTIDKVKRVCTYLKNDDGVFVWGWGSDSTGTPNLDTVLATASSILGPQKVPATFTCPNCSVRLEVLQIK